MHRYWLKIGLGALLIFGIGFGVLSAGRRMKASIESDRDLTIPLGTFVPFKLNGVKVGSVRSLTIQRSAPKAIAGFGVSLRTSDPDVLLQMERCAVSVSDLQRFDEGTTFLCLPSDSGLVAFGEVTIDLRTDSTSRTVVRPLLLRPEVVAEFERLHPGVGSADSMAARVQGQLEPLRRYYADSIKAAELERRSAEYQRRADSLKARSPKP